MHLSLSPLARRVLKKVLLSLSLFACAFLFGTLVSFLSSHFFRKAVPSFSSHSGNLSTVQNGQEADWGLSFPEEGKAPVGNASAEELAKVNAWYLDPSGEKKIYLTFDAGYENGNTAPILDALKKHHAPATFFVVGHFLSENKDLVKRILDEGHTIGNHTWSHPDLSNMTTESDFEKELSQVEDLYQEITGKEMKKYYRPPRGIFSMENLKMAKEKGYTTFFWSLAYVDWKQDAQPSREEAFDKLLKRIHPGAIVLLHSTSSTNAEILDELLTRWEDMGYSFGSLDDLAAAKKNA